MKKTGIFSLAVIIMLGATTPRAVAQKTSLTDFKAQMEAALGGKIIAVQRNSHYPSSSLTQAVNLTVARPNGRTDVVTVQIVFVKAGGGYAAQSMYVLNTSAAMAVNRAAQLPLPEPGGGSGGGGGTGSTAPASPGTDRCKELCFADSGGGPIDFIKAAACYLACKYGLPILPR